MALGWEKELLGLYISDHPFSDFQQELQEYILSTEHIKKGLGVGNIRVAGVINKIKKIMTQKGEMMLFVNIEDTYGSIEAIVFPSVYSETKDTWVENAEVLISGTVSNKEGEAKVICNEVKALSMQIIDDLKKRLKKINLETQAQAKNLFIFFKKIVTADTINQLNTILKNASGQSKVFLAVPIDEQKFRKIETNYYVNFNDENLQKQISGLAEVRFVKLM
jgi:DNA polymerase-3 subunit alpha